ncbi:UDP-N-acetylmuramoyl-L-alanine--D-glutamate ligase [Salinibacterium sp. NSLL150]|uniref:UDP-N-acetylmuramoyl-L-alanine--D-glutamate ligase n=1 Tax=unclassified Salinibacterium TaxID=2632331 RepID=UPI0018CD9CB7|nr:MULTISPECIES: UDP-N-acetylmuramoyl-L-alanine--D-glutamate ligase [unclassified Salinibacterium]MBH0099255.1 UDP-N-acetylmuramoyl-L-alanine--D-glutamate ligase [Salinibacterium sp. NSLL35]MBH0102009.1 UDP-N-acetylmuramoyl-L-alanine--D-glutamate ligase [Salinibacterium sp. NSLL150]MBH0104769.1 UDP-N-acetylmuramoyl-L-alanine--D-glutamate ligase [Salinibacterium sp. NSLL16]MBH0107529.1 UDP-N-acetylmuramoyl-L-alanine--D-glutamate ligase [Salinibacterium sp. NSLL17]
MDQSVVVRDLTSLTSWNSAWSELSVAVLGLGATGFSAADTLTELKARVLVVADAASANRVEMTQVIGAELALGGSADEQLAALTAHAPDVVIVSPGYPLDHVLVEWCRTNAVPMWTEIELAWRLRDKTGTPAEWIAITGTNGKTTTAQLTAHILTTAGFRAGAVGNIGIPVLDAIRYPDGFDFLVVELSSFQLHGMPREGAGAISPLASVCLNFADDHLDWHGSRDAYAHAKATVYANTKIAAVYNRAVPETLAMVENAEVVEGCRAIGFGLDTPGPSDFGIVSDLLADRAFGDDRHNAALELFTLDELRQRNLAAPHMVANILAASALTRAAGVSIDAVREGVASFEIDGHRNQVVLVSGGVTWINDSKATNSHAASASLSAADPVVWILGGLLKGIDVAPLIAKHAPRLKAAIVIGNDRLAIQAAFQRHAPQIPVFEVDSTDTDHVMPRAVEMAHGIAAEGDTVLLAPAAASMDQFTSYADRGDKFAAAVLERVGGNDDDASSATTPTPAAE